MTRRQPIPAEKLGPSGATSRSREEEVTRKRAAIREGLEELEAGKGIPLDEVEAWVESWDTPEEKPRPEPPSAKTR